MWKSENKRSSGRSKVNGWCHDVKVKWYNDSNTNIKFLCIKLMRQDKRKLKKKDQS